MSCLLLFYTLLVWCERKDPNVRFHPLFVCSTSALGGSSALHIPAFPSGGCLIDYAPQVCQLLTSKVNILFIAQLFNSAGTLPKFWSLFVYLRPQPIIITNTNWHLLNLQYKKCIHQPIYIYLIYEKDWTLMQVGLRAGGAHKCGAVLETSALRDSPRQQEVLLPAQLCNRTLR